MSLTTVTRQQLYNQVWATPIETLAKEFSLSGRGLGKLCARHSIPVPPRGYWAKKAAGKKVHRPPLPALDDPYKQKIRFNAASETSMDNKDDPPPLHPLVAYERHPENQIKVPDDLPLTSDIILKTQRLLNRAKRDDQGLTIVPPGVLHIRASRTTHERALRILQAFVTAFNTRNFAVAITSEGVRVTILDEPLGFGIEEELSTVPHPTTFTEQKLIDRGLGWQVPKVDRVPFGKLTLVITNVRGMRHRWSEGASQAEDQLNKFIIGLVRAALSVKRQRAEAEERERQRQDEERQRQEEARRLAEIELRWRQEQARVEHLERMFAVWERHNRLRTLVGSLDQALGEVDSASELGRWLGWAKEHVEHTDPLRRCRQRSDRILTLHYYGYDRDRVAEDGFTEPEPVSYSSEKFRAGVELTARPPRVTSYERALKLELPEDIVLPYEWAQESDWYWRVFRVPATLLNRTLGFCGAAKGGEQNPDGGKQP